MLLNDEWSGMGFVVGYMVGLMLLFLMRRFFTTPLYLRKILATVKFLIVVTREIILSTVFVIQKVVNPKATIAPGIFTLHTVLESDIEITILSLLITLTPGSVVMEVTPEGKTLYIHAIDIPEAKNTVLKSIYAFEEAIMEVTRNV